MDHASNISTALTALPEPDAAEQLASDSSSVASDWCTANLTTTLTEAAETSTAKLAASEDAASCDAPEPREEVSRNRLPGRSRRAADKWLGEQICVSLKLLNGHLQEIQIDSNSTVLDLKRAFNKVSGLFVRMQVLTLNDAVLSNKVALWKCGVKSRDVITVRFPGT